jgi:hypothetical protein
MRSNHRARRTTPLAIKAAPAIVGSRARQPAALASLPPRDDVSAYERELDRLDAAVRLER